MDGETLAVGEMQVSCNNCKKTFTAESTSASSYRKRYIVQNVSRNCWCDACSDSDANMPTAVRSEKLARILCEYVVKEELPFSTFENTEFKKSWVGAVCPKFESLITKKALLRDAVTYYQDERKIVESELLNAPGRICFRIDKLESGCTEEEYVCITACWVDHNWKFQKRIIRLFGLIRDNTDHLATEILSSLGEWNVADRVFSFILDDAIYCDSIVASLKSRLQGNDALLLSGKFCHMSSYSSFISHLGQASIKLMDHVLPKIRSTVTRLKHSIPDRKRFYETARTSFGLDTTKKSLSLDIFTSWDSTILMLDGFLYYQDVLVEFVSNDIVGRVCCLTQEEWALVDEVHKFMKPIYQASKKKPADKTSDYRLYFFFVWKIQTKLLDISNGPPSALSGMAKEMQAENEKYWSSFNHLLACAAVLDPRFKMGRVQYCYTELYGEERAEEIIVAIKKTLFELFEEYKQINAVTSPRVGTSIASSSDEECDDLLSEYFREMNEERKKRSELEHYLDEVRLDLDVFGYWDISSSIYGHYPVLATMARDIIAMVMSMTPLDSGFSLGKKFIAPCRSTLSPGKIEALTCYRDWLRAKGVSSGETKDSGYVLSDEDED